MVIFSREWSESLPRDPLAQERIDDDVLGAVTRENVLAHERGERRLHSGRSAQPVSTADVGRQKPAPLFEHRRTQCAPLREREPLPHAFEQVSCSPSSRFNVS